VAESDSAAKVPTDFIAPILERQVKLRLTSNDLGKRVDLEHISFDFSNSGNILGLEPSINGLRRSHKSNNTGAKPVKWRFFAYNQLFPLFMENPMQQGSLHKWPVLGRPQPVIPITSTGRAHE